MLLVQFALLIATYFRGWKFNLIIIAIFMVVLGAILGATCGTVVMGQVVYPTIISVFIQLADLGLTILGLFGIFVSKEKFISIIGWKK